MVVLQLDVNWCEQFYSGNACHARMLLCIIAVFCIGDGWRFFRFKTVLLVVQVDTILAQATPQEHLPATFPSSSSCMSSSFASVLSEGQYPFPVFRLLWQGSIKPTSGRVFFLLCHIGEDLGVAKCTVKLAVCGLAFGTEKSGSQSLSGFMAFCNLLFGKFCLLSVPKTCCIGLFPVAAASEAKEL